jgi:hypothetical protein
MAHALHELEPQLPANGLSGIHCLKQERALCQIAACGSNVLHDFPAG